MQGVFDIPPASHAVFGCGAAAPPVGGVFSYVEDACRRFGHDWLGIGGLEAVPTLGARGRYPASDDSRGESETSEEEEQDGEEDEDGVEETDSAEGDGAEEESAEEDDSAEEWESASEGESDEEGAGEQSAASAHEVDVAYAGYVLRDCDELVRLSDEIEIERRDRWVVSMQIASLRETARKIADGEWQGFGQEDDEEFANLDEKEKWQAQNEVFAEHVWIVCKNLLQLAGRDTKSKFVTAVTAMQEKADMVAGRLQPTNNPLDLRPKDDGFQDMSDGDTGDEEYHKPGGRYYDGD
jgi:hypothetical protein